MSPEHAKAQYEKAIAAQLVAGFVEIADERSTTPSEPLPYDDLAALAVKADELQERGDVRGELIALDLASARTADPVERERQARRSLELIEQHHKEIFGPLARYAAWHSAASPAVRIVSSRNHRRCSAQRLLRNCGEAVELPAYSPRRGQRYDGVRE